MNDRLYGAWPCDGCGEPFYLITGECSQECGARNIGPQPGPQTEFLACEATIVLYGGSAGAGKTRAMLLDWYRHLDTPGANGLLVRNRDTDISIGGGVWDEALKVYADTDAWPRASSGTRDIRWPSSAVLSFRHLSEQNYQRFKGPGFSWVGIEEANECSLDAVMYLLSRMRSNCGAKPRMRMTCNPDPDSFLADWVDWYLLDNGEADRSKSGVVRWMMWSAAANKYAFAESPEAVAELVGGEPADALSFSFIPALLSDNPAIDVADPGYRARIVNLPDQAEAKRLGKGNWKVRAETGGMLRPALWGGADGKMTEPLAQIARRVRSWDKAASRPKPGAKNPDFTVGIMVAWDIHGRWYVTDLAICRGEPDEVDKLMEETAERDGPTVTHVIQFDPAAAGKFDERHTRKVLGSSGLCGPIKTVRPLKDKVVRVQPVSKLLRDGMTGKAGEWRPIGYILNTGWMQRPYSDGGPAAATVGGVFWQQISKFWSGDPADKDDIPDALAAALEVGGMPVVDREEEDDPLVRMQRLS